MCGRAVYSEFSIKAGVEDGERERMRERKDGLGGWRKYEREEGRRQGNDKIIEYKMQLLHKFYVNGSMYGNNDT